MTTFIDVLVIGGGIAGLSAAARLRAMPTRSCSSASPRCGYHSSGRSATFYHFGIGNDAVRGMTAASSDFFARRPRNLPSTPLWQRKGGAVHCGRGDAS